MVGRGGRRVAAVVVALALGLAGCGRSAKDSSEPSPTPTPSRAPTSTTEPSPPPEVTTGPEAFVEVLGSLSVQLRGRSITGDAALRAEAGGIAAASCGAFDAGGSVLEVRAALDGGSVAGVTLAPAGSFDSDDAASFAVAAVQSFCPQHLDLFR